MKPDDMNPLVQAAALDRYRLHLENIRAAKDRVRRMEQVAEAARTQARETGISEEALQRFEHNVEWDSAFARARNRTPEPDTTDDPEAQTARDALMPQACGECGVEVDRDGAEPEHLDDCKKARKT